MMTPRELLLELLKKDGRPDRQLVQYEAFRLVRGDPVSAYLNADRIRGTRSVNRWGVTIDFPADAPGSMPYITPETKVLKDITRWREQVHAPNLEAHCSEGWETAKKNMAEAADGKHLSMVLMATGIFEQLHFLMGFEDTLTAFYEHPAEVHELIDYILQYRLTYARLLVENLHPDAVLSHDDWGTKDSLFMSPEIWRKFFKEPYRRFYGYFRDHGVVTVHHADSFMEPIVEDMAEIGIQIWQGVLPENDIPALQRRLNGSMVLMGGIGAAVDRPDAGEEEVRAYVRDVLKRCCPGGHYIPCFTYGGPGSVCPGIGKYVDAEIEAYNAVPHLNVPLPPEPRRALTGPSQAAEEKKAETGQKTQTVLDRLAAALRKGRQNAVMACVEEALQEGTDPQQIINGGLVEGMRILGEDYSANRAFVPEMLVAARCMSKAMDVLRPLMQKDNVQKLGRICLGTVKGDMHDIGKHLVKIMLEGGGFEVLDLGVNVSAETFVDTAVREHCDIIACSSLLTTTMSEMRSVVALAEEIGIRDKVKIMIGGAPVTQQFCDEIGADGYADDAAQSVKLAERLMKELKG